MHPLLDGCEPELQKKPDCWIGTCVTPPRAGARFCSQKPDLWAAQCAFPLDTAQLGKPLPRLFDDFLCHHTTQEGTEPWNIPEINVLESVFSIVEYRESSHWKPGKWPKRVKDHQKIENPAIVQKLLGAIYPVEICRCTWPVATSALARYIAATNRAILSNALVAASSSAPKLPMAPVAIFSTLSIPKFCTHAVGCKTDRFQSSDWWHWRNMLSIWLLQGLLLIPKTPALGSEEDSPCSSMEAPKLLYLFKVAVIPPLENHIYFTRWSSLYTRTDDTDSELPFSKLSKQYESLSGSCAPGSAQINTRSTKNSIARHR